MIQNKDQLLNLLIFVGYCIDFPTSLAQRIASSKDWGRHVMYRAIREEYVTLIRKAGKRYVLKSLRLTQKGFDYIAQHDPMALTMIYSRINSISPVYPSHTDRVKRMHAIAIGLVMANAAQILVVPSEKPSLMASFVLRNETEIDPEAAYYYSPFELRKALEEADERTVAKGSRAIGVIVHGHHCYFMYYTGRSRMYWMRLTEENHAAAIKTLLNARGFRVRTISQIIIGQSMSVAAKLCRRPNPYGDRYFVVSQFFDSCCYITNDEDGDYLLRLIIWPELAIDFNRRTLAQYQPPRTVTREYDAVDPRENRPVILNYACDLLLLSILGPPIPGFDDGPILLCFDYQTQTVQDIVGTAVEVRPILRE